MREVERPWDSAPQEVLGANAAWVNRGLGFLTVGGVAYGARELVHGLTLTPMAGASMPARDVSPLGPVPLFSVGTGLGLTRLPKRSSEYVTLVVVGYITATGLNQNLINIGNSGVSSDYVSLAVNTSNRIIARSRNGGTIVDSVSAASVAANELFVAAASFRGYASRTAVLNGVFATTETTSVSTGDADLYGVGNVNRNGGTGDSARAGIVLSAVIFGDLTSELVSALVANPWQLVESQQIYAPRAAAPTGPTVTVLMPKRSQIIGAGLR